MTEEAFSSEAALPEIGFYYPDQFWYSGDRIKNLILFFDGVGLPVKRWLLPASTSLHSHLRSALKDQALLSSTTQQPLSSGVLQCTLKAVHLEDRRRYSYHAPTMVLFGMGGPAAGRLANVRRRCDQVSSEGGLFSICS